MTSKAARIRSRLESLEDEATRRAASAVLGACVADAAARPLHWVYNMEAMEGHLKGKQQPEFLPRNCCPFYSLPTGQNSAYFGLVRSALRAEATSETVEAKIAEDFGPGTEYDVAGREEFKKKKAEGKAEGPYPGRWANGAEIR